MIARQPTLLILLLSLSLFIAACSGGAPAEKAARLDQMADMAMPSDLPADLNTATTRPSDNGLFQVTIAPNLEPLTINQIHSWTLSVETTAGEAVTGAEITVDGGMPQHNHGFPTSPEVTKELGDGQYLVEGVKFNMGGWWEMRFTIAAGDQSDTVTFNIVLPQ